MPTGVNIGFKSPFFKIKIKKNPEVLAFLDVISVCL